MAYFQQSMGIAGLCLVLTAAAGCGGGSSLPSPVPVEGRITVEGKPVGGARVVFQGNAPRAASGITDPDGKFKLTTMALDDGAIPGKHKVMVILPDAQTATVPVSMEIGDDNYDASMAASTAPKTAKQQAAEKLRRYAEYSTSDLEAEVTAEGPNVFQFDLTP